jgi:hypothetical protein
MFILRADGGVAFEAISRVLQRSGRLSAKSRNLLKMFSPASLVYLVCSVCLVYLVDWFNLLVSFNRKTK